MHRSIFIALAALAAGTVAAEESRQPDPTDPQATVPTVEYCSAYAGYRSFAEEKVAPWRESNEAVKGGEGHERHAAQQQASPQQQKPAAKSTLAPAPMGMARVGVRPHLMRNEP